MRVLLFLAVFLSASTFAQTYNSDEHSFRVVQAVKGLDRLVTIHPVDGPRPVRRPPSGIPAAATVTVSVGNDGQVVLRGPVAA